MKPERIFLVRHGESEGNVDREIYSRKPDYALNLTKKGKEQSLNAGNELARFGEFYEFAVYYSPFFRAIETLNYIAQAKSPRGAEPAGFIKKFVREDHRIREQEWHGRLPTNGYNQNAEDERDSYGHFYYRFDGGESCADVSQRLDGFVDTLHRDFRKDDFPKNCLIVSHGMALRLLILKWFHFSIPEFESWGNPENCQIIQLQLDGDKYHIVGEFPFKRQKSTHQYATELTIKFENENGGYKYSRKVLDTPHCF
jgi:broad specificity phosphatase PhoE